MNRQAVAVALGVFVVGYGTNVSTPFLTLYRDRLDLGSNATQTIFVVYVVGILATLLLAGQLSDRFGRKPLLVGSLALSAVASAMLIVGRDSFVWLLAGRVVLGVVSGAGLGVGAAWLQEIMGKSQALKASLIATAVTYGGFGAAPPISVLYEWLGPSPLVGPFLIHIGLAVVTIPFVMRVPETVDVDRMAALGSWRPALRLGIPQHARRGFLWYIAPLGALVFAFPSAGFSLFPVLLSDALPGNEVLLTGTSGMLTAWAGLSARPFLRRVSFRTAMGWGAAIGAAGYLIGTIAFATGWWPLVWPAAIVLGSASGILSAAGLTFVAEMTDDENRGALASTFYLVAYSGMTMPLIISALGGPFGTTPVLVAISGLAAAVAVTSPLRYRLGGLSASAA